MLHWRETHGKGEGAFLTDASVQFGPALDWIIAKLR